MRVQIRCIRRRRGHPDTHSLIEGVGGSRGLKWFLNELEAIREAELGRYEFYIDVSGRYVDVIVATHNGRKYLKAVEDGDTPDNLLTLPECP